MREAAIVAEKDQKRSRMKCIRKFLYHFPKGYQGKKYVEWERDYKWNAHQQFAELLNRKRYNELLKAGSYSEIAETAVRIESRTNLLFSFEKMALRDAIKPQEGAKAFAEGLFNYIYGKGTLQQRFLAFVDVVAALPRKQTRVLTWPLVTVFGFLGNPQEHIFLKPRVTKIAAEKYRVDFMYNSRPNWNTYRSVLAFAEQVRKDTAALKPRDMIDLQSFIWVMGSEEYPD